MSSFTRWFPKRGTTEQLVTKAFWKFCADVARWQDGPVAIIMYPAQKGLLGFPGKSRFLNWRNSFCFDTFSLRSDRNFDSLHAIPNKKEFA